MLRSMKDTKKFSNGLEPQTVSASTAANGADVQDGGSLSFLVSVGDFNFSGSNKLDIVLQHADVDTDGSYADCVDADIYDAEDGENGVAKALDSTDDKNTVHAVHYRGNKRFARVRLVETGTVNVAASVVNIQGHLKANPTV